MTRVVECRPKEGQKNVCACGARFKTPAELRRHLSKRAEPREVWITTGEPVHPISGRRR